jgi:periplasmic copper chaperone A
MKQILSLLILLAIILSACTAPTIEPLVVTGEWARPALAGQNSAIYFTVANPNDHPDHLVEASTDAAEQAELHQSLMDSQGVMSMHQQHTIEIPNRGQVELTPGGFHIMLVNLKQDLKPGDFVKLILKFDKSGEMLLQVPVKDAP